MQWNNMLKGGVRRRPGWRYEHAQLLAEADADAGEAWCASRHRAAGGGMQLNEQWRGG
jgi:hypothetical protein